jgi:hypothetical protein
MHDNSAMSHVDQQHNAIQEKPKWFGCTVLSTISTVDCLGCNYLCHSIPQKVAIELVLPTAMPANAAGF